jgi:hypothetical protein
VVGNADERPVPDTKRTRNDVHVSKASVHRSRDDTPAGIAPRGREVYNPANAQLRACAGQSEGYVESDIELVEVSGSGAIAIANGRTFVQLGRGREVR